MITDISVSEPFTFGQAVTISAITGAGMYAAWKYNVLPKKVAAYTAIGIIGLSFVAVESQALSNTIPYVIGGAAVIGLGILLI